MCTFLTVGVEAKRADTLQAALRAARLETNRTVNPQVARLFPTGDALFLVTHGGCSCDLTLPRQRDEAREAAALAALASKLRRKGYSETKVARALATKKA